jgi:2-polyprenyl-3-methyl-5-hydroxy-6-metoxy-1,4-benzoquinol methylase
VKWNQGWCRSVPASRKHQISNSVIHRWRHQAPAGGLEASTSVREQALEQANCELKEELAYFYLENSHLKKLGVWLRRHKNVGTSVITAEFSSMAQGSQIMNLASNSYYYQSTTDVDGQIRSDKELRDHMETSKKQRHKFFGSDQPTENVSAEDLDARIVRAIRDMVTRCTSDAQEIKQSVEEDSVIELSRGPASRTLNYLSAEGIDIRDVRLMDLGAGLGRLSEEAAVRGATPIAIEPGSGFREIALERIRRGGRGMVVAAVGENLPFRDNSFDVVISLEVLEHVESPAAMLREVRRILKPGGWFYLTCPNYLSFREVHYNVAWLPLLPKTLGSLYLRLRGRYPEFLMTSITYTTLPWVRRELRRLGLESLSDKSISALCRSPDLIKTRWKRAIVLAARTFVSTDRLVKAIAWREQLPYLCKRGISELVQKPYSG